MMADTDPIPAWYRSTPAYQQLQRAARIDAETTRSALANERRNLIAEETKQEAVRARRLEELQVVARRAKASLDAAVTELRTAEVAAHNDSTRASARVQRITEELRRLAAPEITKALQRLVDAEAEQRTRIGGSDRAALSRLFDARPRLEALYETVGVDTQAMVAGILADARVDRTTQ